MNKCLAQFVRGILWAVLPCLIVGAEAQSISWEEIRNLAEKNHPAFKVEDYGVTVQEAQRDQSKAGEDWRLSGKAYYGEQETVSSSVFAPEEVQSQGGDFSLVRPVWASGGEVSLSWDYQFADQRVSSMMLSEGDGLNDFVSFVPEFHQHRVYAAYAQPLLKNRGGTQNEVAYRVDSLGVDVATLQAEENKEQYLLETAHAFIDWVSAAEQNQIMLDRERFAKEQKNYVERQFQENAVDEVDLLRAQNAYYEARQNVASAAGLRAQYKRMLEGKINQELGKEVLPVFDLYDVSASEAGVYSLEKNRVLRIQDIRQEQIVEQLDALGDSRDPQLDLVLAGGLGSGDADYGESWALDKPEYQVNLVFAHPLGNNANTAAEEKGEAQLGQLEEQQKQLRINLESTLAALDVRLQALREVVLLNQKRLETSKEKTAAEKADYEKGESALTFLIQSQDEEAATRLSYVGNAASYQKAIFEKKALLDQLYR